MTQLTNTNTNHTDKEVLLSVRNLCQYFKLGNGVLKAVDNVCFDIHKGEVMGLVGESGCGKTTTGRTIIKLYDATSGDVYFKGHRIVAGTKSYKDAIELAHQQYRDANRSLQAEYASDVKQGNVEAKLAYNQRLDKIKADLAETVAFNKKKIKEAVFDHKKAEKSYQQENVSQLNAHYAPLIELATDEDERKRLKAECREKCRLCKKDRIVTNIQMIFQDPVSSLDPRMTVRDIISEGLVIKGIRDKKYIDEQVNKMLETVGLVSEHANRYPHEFSGGQRQRIGVARAVIMNPSLIIADEPVSALDVSIQAQVINLLNDLRAQMGLTLLFVAHDLSVVKYFCDRIGVMYFGKMVEIATSDELFAHPLHPYTKSLLSAIPIPDPIIEKQRQRITYNPLIDHDYSEQMPSFREVSPGHYAMCNDQEELIYKKSLTK